MKYLSLFLLVLFTSIIYSQSNLEFEFDYAQFAFDSTSNYVEFYYSFNQASMTVIHTDTLDYTQGILHITIEDTITGASIVNKDWLISYAVRDTLKVNKSLIGMISFIVRKGVYKCDIIGKDAVETDKMHSITEFVEINPFLGRGISMGDIQLASNIIQGSQNTSSIFYKNTFEIIPIPTATFGESQPVLFYYTELYNVGKDQSTNKLSVEEHVINSRGNIVHYKKKSVGRTLKSVVEVGTVMTYKLPTDTYTLVLSMIDSASNSGVSSSKKFFVYNPSVEYVDTFQTQQSNIVAGMFGAMSEEELDDFYSKSKYVATGPEIEQYKKMKSESAKREYLTNFWKARDDDQTDDRNQYLWEYVKRIEESNVRFQALSRKGWQTDRGRVYIVYGEPSEIDRYPNQTETRPYEIWYYNEIEGGVVFVFADISGFSDYVLLHSTKRGELRDDYWSRRIVIR